MSAISTDTWTYTYFLNDANMSLTDIQENIMALNDDPYFTDLHPGKEVRLRGEACKDYCEFTVGNEDFREAFYLQRKTPQTIVFGGLKADMNDDLDIDNGEEPGNTDSILGAAIQRRLEDLTA